MIKLNSHYKREKLFMPKEDEIVNVRSSSEAHDFWINAANYSNISSSFRVIKDDHLVYTYEKLNKIKKLELTFQKQIKAITLEENGNYSALNSNISPSRGVERKVFRDVLAQCDNEKENMYKIIETQKKQIKFMKEYQTKLLKINGALTAYIQKNKYLKNWFIWEANFD